ncbi:MAG: TonB-dependent vitamin B12 receptor, partial [Luteimonas sp.]
MLPQFRIVPLALACALALPLLAHAQSDAAMQLDQIVVTATRTAITADASLTPVDVIDRAQIDRSQATSLPDLLRGRAGINLSNQGGAGKLSTVFLRGTESDHVLVLIDGVRVSSATSGLTAFQDIPLASVDRIEIVRGPRSSLYGSDAIGGVIQIFTRRRRGGFEPRMSATVGSHGYADGSIGFDGGSARAWFGLDATYQNDEGIDACRGIGFPVFAGCFTVEPDRDAYRNRSLSLRGGVDASDTLHFEANALRAEGRNEYDGDFTNLSKVVQQLIGGKARWQPSSRVDLQFTAGRNTDASDNFLHKNGSDFAAGFFSTDRDSATLQGDFGIAKNQLLTFGLDWLRDRVDSDTAYDRTRRDNRAALAQYQGTFGAQQIEASLRHDDNEQFGGHTTGSAAWGIALSERWRITAGYGTAFKAPTLNDLYFPAFGGLPTSNPDLRPETSKTWEVGTAYHGERTHARLDAFDTTVKDLIALDASFVPQNLDRARIRGAEAEFGVDSLFGWEANAQISYVDPRNRTHTIEVFIPVAPFVTEAPNSDDGNLLARRARTTARIDLDRGIGKFRFGITALAEGARYDDGANTRPLGGFATLDLRAEYSLTPSWSLRARIANVLDKRYETSSYYNQHGREAFFTVQYRP